MADGGKLRGELSLYRHSLGEPPPSPAICGPRNATADLVELRTPLRGIARAGFDRVGCSHTLRRGSCGCLCRSVCDGELSVRCVCLAKTREDIKSWFDALDLDDYVSFGGKP